MARAPDGGRWLGLTTAALVLGLGAWNLRRPAPEPLAPAPPPPVAPVTPAPPVLTPLPPKVTVETKAPEAPKGVPFDLVDVTTSVGISFFHAKSSFPDAIKNVEPWLASVAGGVSATDFDLDGRVDLYFASAATGTPNALYRNNGDGTFTDVAAKAGLADLNNLGQGSSRPLFFDFDNDGDPDLVLTTQYCPRVFRNRGDGTFAETTAEAGITHCALSYASNALDLDGDGDLDLVIADYFPPTNFHIPDRLDFMPNSITTADNGGEVTLYRNDGTGRFEPFPGNLGVRSKIWVLSVGVWDVDGDGRRDLYLATDYNDDSLYLNKGTTTLLDVSDRLEHKYSRSGMNSEFVDLEGDGRPSVYVTHIYEPPFKLGGNTLWTFERGATGVRERARELGIASCGWSWGAKFADFDNDGLMDLAVANGYISANRAKDYWYRMSVLASATREVISNARNWPPMEDFSMSGFQRKCVYRNVGESFELVTHDIGMKDDIGDGRVLSAVDPFDEGRPSLAAGYVGSPARLWHNVDKTGNAWVGLNLKGKRPRDPWGAAVTLKSGGRVQRRELQPANSFMGQSDPRLLFGLGPGGKAEDVTVRWPSGLVQKLGALEAGRYHTVSEP